MDPNGIAVPPRGGQVIFKLNQDGTVALGVSGNLTSTDPCSVLGLALIALPDLVKKQIGAQGPGLITPVGPLVGLRG